MYYYPVTIPKVNIMKLKHNPQVKHKTYKTTMLYSNEGIFQIRDNHLFRTYFDDDDTGGEMKKINGVELVWDKTKVHWIPTNKIPYNYEKREISISVFEKPAVKMYVEEYKGRFNHIYFYVKTPGVYGVDEEIAEFLA